MPKQSGSSARIYCLVARMARVAAVIRRGPSKQVMLSKWNLADDSFEDGQWFKGRIYERRGDISPDGEYIIYFGGNQKPPYSTWTAISTLPWFTAHVLWSEGDTWGGGGLFALSRCVAINSASHNLKPTEGQMPRSWPEVISISDYHKFDRPMQMEDIRMERDGWVIEQEAYWKINEAWWRDKTERFAFSTDTPSVLRKQNAAGTVLHVIQAEAGERGGRWHVCSGRLTFPNGNELDLGDIDWADFDHNGDVLYAFNGALYRRGSNGEADAKLVRDLNNLKFEARIAPYDTRHQHRDRDKTRTWHPLDGQD